MKEMNLVEPFVPCGKTFGDGSKCTKGFIIRPSGADRCECWVKYRNHLSLLAKMIDSNLITENSSKDEVKRLIEYSLDDYKGNDINHNIPKIRKFIRLFDEKYNSVNLFFSGENGTQKTTVAKNIVVELLRKDKTAYYTITKDFIDLIMASDRDEEKASLLNKILRVDLLVLEEFSTDKMALYSSDYKQSVLTTPLKKRFESIRKSTIIISNSSMQELKDSRLGSTIGNLVDRETKECQFCFTDRYGDYVTVDLSSIWD